MLYTVPGVPTPLARARIGRGRKPWDSQKKLKNDTAILLEYQHNGAPLYEGALHFDIVFFFPFPQTVSKSKIEQLRGKSHVFKPDLSNLIKFIEDVGNGILYHDDSLIASISARKCYDDIPRTEFIIKII
jgi:Holliday junction resolvase RusA-like endonuclease